MRIDFPSFNGDDLNGLLNKVNHLFSFYNTLPRQKLRLASFYMEGQTLIWFQDLEDSRNLRNWEDFTRALLTRFGTNSYNDPMESLTRLKQNWIVEEYKSKFEALSNRLKGLSNSYKSCFLNGLRDDIRLLVRMFSPDNLLITYRLAKIQEEHLGVTRRSWKSLAPNPELGLLKAPSTNSLLGPK